MSVSCGLVKCSQTQCLNVVPPRNYVQGITIMDEGYEEIQLRLSYSDVEGQLQKNPTGALAKMAKKHEADLAVSSHHTARLFKALHTLLKSRSPPTPNDRLDRLHHFDWLLIIRWYSHRSVSSRPFPSGLS